MMNEECDALVIGAGPAGSAAAIALAAAGRRVALVDRAVFPREKACGDGLSPRALLKLHQWGVWERLAEHAAMVRRLHTFDLRSGAVTASALPSCVAGRPDVGAVVPRERLDEALRLHAVAMGVRWCGGVNVSSLVERDHGRYAVVAREGTLQREFRCAGVVVADGAAGTVSRRLRVPTDTTIEGVAIRQYWCVPDVAEAFTICVPLEAPEGTRAGYGWIFPLAGGRANVGVGVYRTRDAGSIHAIFDGFIGRLRQLDPHWRFARPCGAPKGELLRCGFRPDRIMSRGIVLAGDAAGSTNPYTGEGIAQALETGDLAGQALARYLTGCPNVETEYAERLVEAFPETTRSAPFLPWIIERGERFACEFWGLTGGMRGPLAKATRRITLDEEPASIPGAMDEAEATWRRVHRGFADETPLLAQFLEAFRKETCGADRDPVLRYCRDVGAGPFAAAPGREVMADLLALSALVLLLVDATVADDGTSPSLGNPRWTNDAIALGTADMVFARYLQEAATVSSTVASGCTRALRLALAEMEAARDASRMDGILRELAARACDVARRLMSEAA